LDLDQLKRILDLVREHDLSEFEIEHDGLRLKIRKAASVAAAGSVNAMSGAGSAVSPGFESPPPATVAPASTAVAASGAALAASAESDVELAVVKSPIVGTFFRSAEPGAPSFVEIGSAVKKGDVLCIIEARN